jgi:enamine deaminase RidA (YjgF/YER057c/UK114 family)
MKVGNLLFLAGQGPFDANGERVGSTFADQARATFDNLERVANAAGTSLKNAVRIGAYLRSLEYMDEPYPVRTTIPVELRGFDIEVDAILFVPDAG